MQCLHNIKLTHSSDELQWYQFILVVLVQLLRQGGAASGGVGEAGGVSRERDS